MEVVSILWTSTALLVLTALGGLVMAGISLKGGRHPPIWLAMGHGLLAAAAVTLLLYAALTIGLPTLALAALALLLISAAGGVTLNLNYHWKNLPLPRWLIGTHALAAIIGFALLLFETLTSRNL